MKRLVWMMVLVGCATAAPKELLDARQAYDTARIGTTGQVAPTELYQARKALENANRLFAQYGDTAEIRDWAYVASRMIQVADASARTELDRRTLTEVASARDAYRDQQQRSTKSALDATREQLTAEQRTRQSVTKDLADMNAQLETERQERQKIERKLEKAMSDLATVASVKEESRGVVITLSGSVLFPTGKSELLQTAQLRLDQVATALTDQVDGHRFIVEGHTDSLGSDESNRQLSLARAMAVRDYLISKGVRSENIEARGLGESRPLVGNDTAENRANNRRVEIIIEPKPVS